MNPSLTLNYPLRIHDVDVNSQLTVAGLLSLYQEAATLHSCELGVDYQTLAQKSNAYWVVARIRIALTDTARFGDTVTACTWPLPPVRATFGREMTITCDNRTVANLTSEWCMLDLDTHRLRRAETTCFPADVEYMTDHTDAGAYLRLPRKTWEMEFCYSRIVRYSDLDMNHHTNNVAYARMALDTFSVATLSNHPVKWFEIHFLKESHEGDTLHIYRQIHEDSVYVLGTKGAENEPVFTAAVGM